MPFKQRVPDNPPVALHPDERAGMSGCGYAEHHQRDR
jgi:hypothetical protein